MEELKNIKVVVRWGLNGRKYVWVKPSQKKIIELIKKYDYEQICDGCLWLSRQKRRKENERKKELFKKQHYKLKSSRF